MNARGRSIELDQIKAHYQEHWGALCGSKSFQTPDNRFTILKWSPVQTGEGVFEVLAEVAQDGNGTGKLPTAGDTITLAFDLWENTSARSFLFTNGGEAIIPPIQQNGKRVDFIQLVPLFPAEIAFKTNTGEAALWSHFEACQTPYWDPSRNSAL